MNRRVPTLIAIAVTVLACGRSRPPAIGSSPEAPGRVNPSAGGSAEIHLQREMFVDEDVVDGALLDVWKILPQAWSDAMVPIGETNTATKTLRSGVYRAPSRIVGKSLADFLDCGYSLAGPRVIMWDVQLSVTTALIAESPTQTRVASVVNGTARPRDGSNTNAVGCTSRGELERIIAGNIRVKLGG